MQFLEDRHTNYMQGVLYILQSQKSKKYYVGSTNFFERRLLEHNARKKRYTSKYAPWKIIYIERYPTLAEARQRERKIKKWKSRKMIDKLINRGSLAQW